MATNNPAVPSQRLKQGSAPKTGQRAAGNIQYILLTDAERQEVFISITGNDGGGYFSREAVPFAKVEACAKGCKKDQPLPSKTFRSAFVGKSSNNAGFLAAVLRHEGLLAPIPESIHQHRLGGDWAAWKQASLKLPAEPYVPASPKSDGPILASAITDKETHKPAGKKSRKTAPEDQSHPTSTKEAGRAGEAGGGEDGVSRENGGSDEDANSA